MTRLALLLTLLPCGVALVPAAETPSPALLVLAKTDHALMIVDPHTLKVVGQVPSGPDPHEVAVSDDGKLAYISNYGGGSLNTITVVDLVNQKALPVIDLGPLRGPHGLVYVGGKLWFTAEGAKVIGSYDPSSMKIDWVLGTGQNRTHMIFVSGDTRRLITSNVSSASMTLIDQTIRKPGFGPGPGGPPNSGGPPLPPNGQGGPGGPPQADWDETVIPVGRGAEGFDVSPGGQEAWAANAQDGTISIIDLGAKKVVATLAANVKGANRLKFTPDGKLVFVSSLGGPDLVILDASTRMEVKRVKIGSGAAGIQMNPDGRTAYVACTPDDYVTVIDIQSLTVKDHLVAGKQPDGLAWVVRR